MSAPADFIIRNRALQRYILADEKVVIATHRHWSMIWEPILTTAGAFVLGLVILVNVSPTVRNDMGWVWVPFFILGLRLLYKWLEWRARWFVLTDRRLLLLDGFLVHRVAMMPSEKVTDLGYERTPLGQVLGFGTFIFESAGQDQALDRVDWVPRPDARYRLIIATLFHPEAADAEAAAQGNPDGRPEVSPAADLPPSVAPPALMPRIGRRSNPPTQRIEIPATWDDGPAGTAERAAGAGGGSARGAAGAGGGGSARGAAGGAGATGGAGGVPGAAGGTTDGGTGAPVGAGQAGGAAAPAGGAAGHTGGAPAPVEHRGTPRRRPNDGAGDEHVPGGPTADVDRADELPSPFIEGGKDPKIR